MVCRSAYLLDGLHQAAEVVGEDVADVADAERVGLGDFTRVDDEAALFQLQVEGLEVETGFGIVERGDDGRLLLVGQQRAEAQRAHAFDEHAMVLAVACVTGFDAGRPLKKSAAML